MKFQKIFPFKKDSDNIARMGITWHAADELGELSYIALDEIELGETLENKEVLCDIESVKAAQTLNMPVTAKILAIKGEMDKTWSHFHQNSTF